MSDRKPPFGECDCCNQLRVLSRCWVHGIETFACNECRGWCDEDYDEDIRWHTETANG